MNPSDDVGWEKWACASAGLAMLASVGWSLLPWSLPQAPRAIERPAGEPVSPARAFTTPRDRLPARWLAADVSSSSGLASSGLFDARPRRSVETGDAVTEVASADKRAPRLELLQVERTPYPVQLVGWGGERERERAIFVAADGAVWLAGSGERIGDTGLRVATLDWRGSGSRSAGASMVEPELRVVVEEAAGRRVELSSRERKFTDELVATLRAGESVLRAVRRGEERALGGERLRVEELQADPPAAVVVHWRTDVSAPRRMQLTTLPLRPRETGSAGSAVAAIAGEARATQ